MTAVSEVHNTLSTYLCRHLHMRLEFTLRKKHKKEIESEQDPFLWCAFLFLLSASCQPVPFCASLQPSVKHLGAL